MLHHAPSEYFYSRISIWSHQNDISSNNFFVIFCSHSWIFHLYVWFVIILSLYRTSLQSIHSFTESTVRQNVVAYEPTIAIPINTFVYVDKTRNISYNRKFDDKDGNSFYKYNNICVKLKRHRELIVFFISVLFITR